jgi:imidazolonepropionase-like amidohydrolase
MLRSIIVLAVCGIACRSSAPAKQLLQPGDLALVGATVIPMDHEGALADRTVVVRGDRIAIVAPSSTIDTTGATVIDLHGKWLLPGLADMHVHTQGERDFAMYLLNGVTTVRDMFGSPQHLTWRSAIAAGTLDGPTLITAGPIVDGNPPVWPGSAVVTDAESARATVRAQKQAGYDLIKVYSNLSREAYDAIAAEAKAQHIPFAGHVPHAVGLDGALASGQRSIEHLDGYIPIRGEPRADAQTVQATVQSGVWNCPTLVVTDRIAQLDDPSKLANTPGLEYVPAATRTRWDPKHDFRLQSWTPAMYEQMRAKNKVARKLVADLSRAGAKLVLGTDTGNPYVVPGFAVHAELGLLVASGLTPWQALHMATVAPAELVDQPGAFGAVIPGARADLLVVDRDPLVDITALAQPSLVVVRGKRHERAALLAAVEKPPADPYDNLPALEPEGTNVVAARYDVSINGGVIGHERTQIGELAGGRVVRGQAVYDAPRVVFQYRATPDGVAFADGLTVTRAGPKVIAKPKAGDPVELATKPDAVIAPQTVAEFVWYADRLRGLREGGSKAIEAAEVMVEDGVRLEPGTFTFVRLPDADGRRVYSLKGTHGALALDGTFTVDADQVPHDIEVKLRWGTFAIRRVE